MGGLGSGREAEVYSGTVEESLQLDVNRFVRSGVIRQGCKASGIIEWERLGKTTSSIGYETQCYAENGYVRLNYRVHSLYMGDQVLNHTIDLITTRPHFGGVRWWFMCPGCENNVTKLYQPPGDKYFLCRTCQNLTYTSCRESGNSLYHQLAAETGLDIKQVKRVLKRR